MGNASGQIHLGYGQRPAVAATTEHAMELIDLAAANGLKGVLVRMEYRLGTLDRCCKARLIS